MVRLRLATRIPPCAATASNAQTSCDWLPPPAELSIRAAKIPTPGATPTTPSVLLIAPTVPATCVPWPKPSAQSPVSGDVQLYPPMTLRSASGATPESTTATVPPTEPPEPFVNGKKPFRGAFTRSMPVGMTCAVGSTGKSGKMPSTCGTCANRRAASAVRFAAKPVISVS